MQGILKFYVGNEGSGGKSEHVSESCVRANRVLHYLFSIKEVLFPHEFPTRKPTVHDQ